MRKRISLKTRRPDLSRSAFRAHYEARHVPLGLGFVDRFQWRRYVRNHVLESWGAPVGFDCYAEFWVDDDFDDASLDEFIRSPAFRVLDEDDRRFLDVSKRLALDVRELSVPELPLPGRPDAAGAREDASSMKLVVTWRADGSSEDVRRQAASRIVASLGARVAAASLDITRSAVPPEAPFDTLLSLWLDEVEPCRLEADVAPADRWSLIAVEPVETSRALLFRDVGPEG